MQTRHHPFGSSGTRSSYAAVLGLLLAACSGAPEEVTPSPTLTPTPTATPAAPTATPGPTLESLDATLELLDAGTFLSADTLPDHTVVLGQNEQLVLRSASTGTLTALENPAGILIDAVWLSGDPTAEPPVDAGLLVSGENGYFARVGDALVSSPLQALLADEGPGRLLVTPGPTGEDLWIATPEGLHLYRSGTLSAVAPGELPTQDALLTWGPWDPGHDALWISSQGVLYVLIPDGSSFQALELETDLTVDGLCTDASKQVWLVADGVLYQRTAEDPLTPVLLEVPSSLRQPADPLPPPPLATPFGLTCGAEAEGAWVFTDVGLWHIRQAPHMTDVHTLILNAPLEDSFLGGDAQGRATFSGISGTQRLVMGRPTYAVGLDAAAQATTPQEVLLLPTLPAQLTGLSASLGGLSLTVTADPLRFTLDPAAWTSGPYTLVLDATYQDTSESFVSEFQLILGDYTYPSWEEDIFPIYAGNCSKCHSVSGGVLPLDTAQAWEVNIEGILSLVSDGTMPPGNADLSEEEVYTIRAWMEGGFLP